MDENLQKYFDEKFKHVEAAVADLKQAEVTCQSEVFPRLLALEIKVATNMAASWRGAFIIGGCSLTGAILAHVLGRILHF